MSAPIWLRRLENRVLNIVGRAILRATDDGGRVQVLKLDGLTRERLEGVERVTDYGFASHAPAGSHAVIVCPQGDRGHAVAIAVESAKDRPTGLAEGDVWIYDRRGQRVKFTDDGVQVECIGELNASATLNAKVSALGEVTVQAGGAATVQAGGSAKIEAGGDLTAQAAGQASLQAAGTVDVSAGGAAAVTAGGQVRVAALGAVAVQAAAEVSIQAALKVSVISGGAVVLTGAEGVFAQRGSSTPVVLA